MHERKVRDGEDADISTRRLRQDYGEPGRRVRSPILFHSVEGSRSSGMRIPARGEEGAGNGPVNKGRSKAFAA